MIILSLCYDPVDRMENVEILDAPVSEGDIIRSADVPDFTSQAFNMYGGPVENAVLQFSSNLIGVVYDHFGEETQMIRQDDNTCIATVRIQVSPTFWGWLFTSGNEMKILSPTPLVQEWNNRLASFQEDND